MAESLQLGHQSLLLSHDTSRVRELQRDDTSASYVRVPRTTVIRRLNRLQSWGLIDRRGRHRYLHETTLNSANGMRTYQQVRRILSRATKELSILDALQD